MVNQRIRLSISVLFVFLFCSIHFANAQGIFNSVNSMLEHGLSMVEQGKIQAAIDDFSRALLLEDTNETAIAQLKVISHENGLTADERLKVYHFLGLTAQLENLQKRIQYYTLKKSDLIAQLTAKGHTSENLDILLADVETGVGLSEVADIPFLRHSKIKEQDPLAALNENLNFKRGELSNQLIVQEKQFHFLRELNQKNMPQEQKVASKPTIEAPKEKVTSTATSFATLEPRRTLHIARVSVAKEVNNIDQLKQQLGLVVTEVDRLQKEVNQRNAQIDTLTEQVVKHSLQMTEKDTLLSKNEGLLNELKNELKDYQARLELGQQLMTEKDRAIERLDTSLNNKSAEMKMKTQEAQLAVFAKDVDIDDLKAELELKKKENSAVQKELNEQIKDVRNLTNELDRLKGRYVKTQESLDSKREEIRKLKTELVQAKGLRSENEKLKYFNNKNSVELEEARQRLNEYRTQMSGLQQMVSQKDKEIAKLNQKTGQLQDKYEQEKRENLKSKQEVAALANKFKELRNWSTEKVRLQKVIKDKESVVKTLEESLESYRVELAQTTQKFKDKNREMRDLNQRMTNMEKTLSQKVNEISLQDKKMTELKNNLQTVKGKQDQSSETNDRNDDLQKEFSKMQDLLNQKNAEIEENHQVIAKLEKEAKTISVKNTATEAKDVKSYEKKIGNYIEQIQGQQDRIKKKSQEIVRLKERIDEQNHLLTQRNKDLKIQENKIKQFEKGIVENKKLSKDENRNEEIREVKLLRERVVELKTDLETIKVDLEKRSNELQSRNEEIKSLKRMITFNKRMTEDDLELSSVVDMKNKVIEKLTQETDDL
ncbi:MAG: hypothetical protein KC733_05170, partial [Candidatus Omnitrophica bacterium]|nr:hypothetical protein [Candidatus Omnitrophota bacterium]